MRSPQLQINLMTFFEGLNMNMMTSLLIFYFHRMSKIKSFWCMLRHIQVHDNYSYQEILLSCKVAYNHKQK